MLKRIQSNAFWLFSVAIAEMIIFFFSEFLRHFFFKLIIAKISTENAMLSEFLATFFVLSLFSIHIILCILYMYIQKPESLQFLRCTPKSFLKGLGIGFLANAIISVGAILGTGMSVSFSGIQLILIPLFIANTIQCAAEEVLLRAFVPSFLEERYSWDTIAFASGVLFVFHHVNNMIFSGFNPIFCLNVFLVGCLLTFSVRITRNVWWAIGFHSAWNFTQEYLFGLPNSGMSSNLSILTAANAKSNFFFNEVFGNEGSLLTSLVTIALIILVLRFYKSRRNSE